jgi:4'-phosphopantetheinyl transferase
VHARRVSDDAALEDLLDDAERMRAVRRSSPARYITAHALLRTVVGERTGVDPRDVTFERHCATCGSTAHGKPVVCGHRGLYVSLSYAGELAVVAVSEAGETGIDVEEVDEADFDGFGAVTLAREEEPPFALIPLERLGLARARVWARKESVLKATGHGLVVDPREVVVTGPDEAAGLVAWRGDRPLPSAVQLHDILPFDPGYAAAVTVLCDAPVSVRLQPR